MHLASWAIGGAVIAVSAWFFSFLPIPRFHSNGCGFWAMMWMNRSRIIAFLGPLLIGLPISVWAESRFNGCVRDEIWSEAELAPVLSLVVKPIWSWGSWMILVACVLFLVLREHSGGGSFVYILLYPLQLAMRMRHLLTPSRNRMADCWLCRTSNRSGPSTGASLLFVQRTSLRSRMFEALEQV
jgi:hypothetical protein